MIFQSQLADIEVPNMNLVQFVLGECRRRASANHQVFVDAETDEALTLDELESLVYRVANGLRTRYNIQPGDVVATVAGNSIYYPIVAYAIVAAGAVCTPANPSYTPRELAHQLGNSQCRAVVVGDGLLDQVSEALLLTEHRVEHVLHLDEARSGAAGSIFELAAEPALEPPALDYAQAAAYLCYSSGTTGKPKGVVLTHANMVANAQQIARVKQLDEPTMNSQTYETFLGLAPFCHAYGLSYVLHSSVMLGGRVVVMRQYSFERFLRAVQRHRITYGYLVPPIVCALSKDARVDAYDVSSMHTVLSGGAAL
ncbi:4-coumarate--CoA ligase, partial [Coemansia sp. RSA 2706]